MNQGLDARRRQGLSRERDSVDEYFCDVSRMQEATTIHQVRGTVAVREWGTVLLSCGSIDHACWVASSGDGKGTHGNAEWLDKAIGF